MFENNKKRSSLKYGKLSPFDINKDENNQDIKNFPGNSFDNFTSPEPYNFYLHSSNSDLSNTSTETYNRAGSKNYFISETPTPFLYDDIVNKGNRTDTIKKNKPTTISNNNPNRTQKQKFYSNSYGLSLDKNEIDDGEVELNNETNSNKDYTQSIWSVSPPFSATRTEDTNLDTVIEDEKEIIQDLLTKNSVFNSSTVNEHKEPDPSNDEMYNQREAITYHNDYPSEDSNEYHKSNDFEYYASSSTSSSLKNQSKRRTLSNSSIKVLPRA
ncbi:hypothetical protein BCR36DRAFT_412163, partial [Piromyces finnis]